MEGQREFTKDKSKRSTEETSDEDRKRAKTEGESSETASQCEGEIPGAALDKPSTSSERPVWSESEDIQFSTDEDSEDSEGSTSGSSGVDEELYDLSTSGNAGAEENVFDLVLQLNEAVEAERYSEAQRLQTAIRSAKHMFVTDWRRTPLHLAAMVGSTAAVSWLAAREGVNEGDVGGQTALHYAAVEGRPQCVEVLINAGADVHARNDDGHTALHWAATYGHTQCVQMLINAGADVNVRNEDGQIPLQLALALHRENVIQLLINAGSDLNLLGKDKYSVEVVKGSITKQQLDESRGQGVQEISADKVKSTKEFEKSPAAKMIIIGKHSAGKTTLVRTMEEKKPVLIPEGSEGRTKGIEVSLHQLQNDLENIHLYAYDFGGQPSYFPLHQVYLSPHSLFSLVADFSRLVEDERETMQYYYTVNQRVVQPVYITVGTKIDTCSADDVNEKKERLFTVLRGIEKKEVNALHTREKKIKRALQQIEKNGSEKCTMNYEFQGLPKEKLAEKLALVDLRLSNRPRLSENTMTVSSHEYRGIKDLQQEIVNIIFQNPDMFPSFFIPRTWFAIENKVQDLKKNIACIQLSRFQDICKENKVVDENEIDLLLNYLRVKGQLIHYTDHRVHDGQRRLRDTVFIDPHHVTSILSLVFDHEHYEGGFWEKMKSSKYLPTDQCDEAKQFVERGIISETLLEYILKDTKMEDALEQVVDLMKEFDLCFELEQSKVNLKLRGDVRYFLLPSLLKEEPSTDFTQKIWPEMSTDASECILQLFLFTPVEPYGLFDKATVQLNYLFYKRLDMKRCMVADIHDYKDKLKMRMCLNEDGESYSMFFTIRTDPTRLPDTCSTMKFMVAVLMELMKFYPTVLWDWYILCPLCRISTPASRWPAENSLFKPTNETPPVQCDLCKERMETVGGFPVVTDMPPKFSSLLGDVVRKIGGDWCRLLRRLCKSLDDADKIIEDTRHAASSLTDSAAGALSAWRRKFGTEASFNELVVALDRIQRRDLTGEADQYELLRAADSEKKITDGFSELILTTSEFIGGEWRHLGRDLYASLDEVDRIIDQISATSTYRYDQPECAYQMLRAWQKQGGTYDCLIEKLSVDHKDILSKAGIDHDERRATESGKKTSDAFAILILTASKFVGNKWRHLGRDLYTSLDEVDRKIDEIYATYFKDQRECAYQILRAWQKQAGTYDGLIEKLSVDHKDILSKAGIEVRNTATNIDSEDLQGGDTDEKSRRRGALKMVLLEISKSIPNDKWRNLARHLEKPVSDDELINIEVATSDLRERVHQVLVKWRHENADSATYAVLRTALINLKLQDVAVEVKDICDKFQIDENEALKE